MKFQAYKQWFGARIQVIQKITFVLVWLGLSNFNCDANPLINLNLLTNELDILDF